MRMRSWVTREHRWQVAVVHFAQGAACVVLGLVAAVVLALVGAQLPLVLGPPVLGGLAAIASVGRGVRYLLIGFEPDEDE